MIVCFNCSTETKKSLDFLLESGQYKDYSEAISLAIANLVILQEEVLRSGGVVIGGDVEASLRVSERAISYSTQGASQARELNLPAKSLTVPAIFHLDGLIDSPPRFAELPDDIWAIGHEIPTSRWVFGQYNRLLPAKASCRAFTVTGFFIPMSRAFSTVVTMAQAAPSLTPQQSKSPRGCAIMGAAMTWSILTRFRKWALGFMAPFSWLFTETWAMARLRSCYAIPCFAA